MVKSQWLDLLLHYSYQINQQFLVATLVILDNFDIDGALSSCIAAVIASITFCGGLNLDFNALIVMGFPSDAELSNLSQFAQ
jgi:hypothetical protein